MALLQVIYGKGHPWRILVVCILLNRAQGKQARPVLDKFFYHWPGPRAVQKACVEGISRCGRYAQEAYDMLVLGKRWHWPEDPKLRRHMELLESWPI